MAITPTQSPGLAPRPAGELQNQNRTDSPQNNTITVEYEVIEEQQQTSEIKTQDGFENFLENTEILNAKKATNDSTVFDPASEIANQGVYKDPGKDFPV